MTSWKTETLEPKISQLIVNTDHMFVQVHWARRYGGPGVSSNWQGWLWSRFPHTGVAKIQQINNILNNFPVELPYVRLNDLTCLISGVLHLWVLERGIAWDWPGRSGRHYSPESKGRQGLENLKTSTSCPHVVKSLRKKTNNPTIHINGQTLLREPRN